MEPVTQPVTRPVTRPITRPGESAPTIILSGGTIPEDADIGDPVGTLSVANGTGSYTFTLIDDAGGLFAIDGDILEVADTLLPGSYGITVDADNGIDPPIQRDFTIFATAVIQPLAISGTPTTTAQVGAIYGSFQVAATGGVPPYAFSVSSGALPAGIVLDPDTGIVDGTPTEDGEFANIVMRVTDDAMETEDLAPFTLTVAPASVTLTIFGTPVTTATEDEEYAGFVVGASGGTPPYTFSVASGALPAGITLNGSTGEVSGTPTENGTFANIVLRVTDDDTDTADLSAFTLTVAEPSADPLLSLIQNAAEDSWTQYITITNNPIDGGVWNLFQPANRANFDAFTAHGAVDNITQVAFASDSACSAYVVSVADVGTGIIGAFSNPILDRATGDLWRGPGGGHNKGEHGEIMQVRARDGVAVLRHKSATLTRADEKPSTSVEVGPGTDLVNERWGFLNADGEDAARARELYGYGAFVYGRLFDGGIQMNSPGGTHGPGRIGVFDPSNDSYTTWFNRGTWQPSPTGGATAYGVAHDHRNNRVVTWQGGGSLFSQVLNAYDGTPVETTLNTGSSLAAGMSHSNGWLVFADPVNIGKTGLFMTNVDADAVREFQVIQNIPVNGWDGFFWSSSGTAKVWNTSGGIDPATTFSIGAEQRGWEIYDDGTDQWVATSQGDGEIYIAKLEAPYTGMALVPFTSGSPTGDVPTLSTQSGHRMALVWLDPPYNCFAMAKWPTASAPGGAWFYKHTGWSATPLPLTLLGTPVTTATEGAPYAGFRAFARHGVPPFTYSVASGTLPDGITLDSQYGFVSGLPTEDGVFADIVLRVTDAHTNTADLDPFTLTVGAAGTNIFVADSFTDTNSTALNAHSGETGAAWTVHSSYSGAPIISSNRLVQTGTTTRGLYASGTPANADYDVAADFIRTGATSGDAAPGVCGRMSTSANTFYHLRYAATNARWELYKFVAGSATLLGTYSDTLSTGVPKRGKLEMRGTAIKGYVDDVERISVNDSGITAAGRAGLRWFGSGDWALDSFEAVNA